MRILMSIVLVLIVGCATTQPDPSRPMPTCASPDECAAKMETARAWLFAHNYKIPYDKPGRMTATSPTVMMQLTPEVTGDVTTINIVAQCLPGLEMMLGLVGCSESYSALYDITQVLK